MLKLKSLLLALVLDCIFFSAPGQKNLKPGYIIDLRNDTLYGFIDNRGYTYNSEKCVFYGSLSSDPVTYLPGEIKGYRFPQGSYYISHSVILGDTDKEVFLEYMVKGIISLYYLKELNMDHYFIEKDGKLYDLKNNDVTFRNNYNDSYQVSSNTYKGVLTYLLYDTKDILPTINSSSFTRKSLSNLTQKYHDLVCRDGKCIVYAKDPKLTKIDAGVEIRYDFFNNHMRFSGILSNLDFTSNPSFMYGIVVNFRMDAINQKFNLAIKGFYNVNSITGFCFKEIINNNPEKYVINLNDRRVTGAIEITYKYPKGKFNPTAGLGYEMGFGVTEKSSMQHSTYNQSGVLLTQENYADNLKFCYSYTLSGVGGLSYTIAGHVFYMNLHLAWGVAYFLETDYLFSTNYIKHFPKVASAGIAAGFLF